MSYLVIPFDVSSAALAEPVHVRFIHLLTGISTRHSDTVDCMFWVGGRKVTVALSCAAITELREREHKDLTDQQLADIAALVLRRTLQQGYDASLAELYVSGQQLRQLARELGYL